MRRNQGCFGGCMTLIMWFLIVSLVLAIVKMIAPAVLAVSLYLIYYYTKEKPNEDKKRYAIMAAIASACISLTFLFS